MDDLVTWLRAVLDDVEATARAADDEAGDYEVVGSDLAEMHFLNWKPDGVLRDVASKRAIVDGYLAVNEGDVMRGPWDGCGDECELRAVYWGIQHLAAAFDDRDGYREEWRP